MGRRGIDEREGASERPRYTMLLPFLQRRQGTDERERSTRQTARWKGGPKFPLGYNTFTYDFHENVYLKGRRRGIDEKEGASKRPRYTMLLPFFAAATRNR